MISNLFERIVFIELPGAQKPVPAGRRAGDSFHLSLNLGDQGSLASRANLLSQCGRFSLGREQAREIIDQVEEAVRDWEAELIRAGVSPADREAVRWCFEGSGGNTA